MVEAGRHRTILLTVIDPSDVLVDHRTNDGEQHKEHNHPETDHRTPISPQAPYRILEGRGGFLWLLLFAQRSLQHGSGCPCRAVGQVEEVGWRCNHSRIRKHDAWSSQFRFLVPGVHGCASYAILKMRSMKKEPATSRPMATPSTVTSGINALRKACQMTTRSRMPLARAVRT